MVELIGPSDSLITQNFMQELSWLTLTGATEYRLQIWSPDTSGTLTLDETLTVTTSSINFKEGTFTWQVHVILCYTM